MSHNSPCLFRHCISKYGQTCYNCASVRLQRPGSIVTGNKYKFGEQPKQTPVQRKATPARLYHSQRFSYPKNPYRSPWGYYASQRQKNIRESADAYRYTYSYGSSSGSRRRRASHYVHKLRITVARNVTARDKLLEFTPVLESLQKTFHYEILRGNKNLFRIKVHKGISALHSKKPLKKHVGLHKVYLKGRTDKVKTGVPSEMINQIEFSSSGVPKKLKMDKNESIGGISEKKGNAVLGLSEAKKFHIDLFIDVV